MPGPVEAYAEQMLDLAVTRLVEPSPPRDENDVERVVTEVANQLRGDISLREQIGESAWPQVSHDLEERVRGQARFSLEQRTSIPG